MEALLLITASQLIFDLVITFLFASYVVRVFEIGQRTLYVRMEQANDVRSHRIFEELPFVERLGYIVMYGSLMTKLMIVVILPLCMYAGLSLGYTIERSIPVAVQAFHYYTSL
jgi:hypothetical protein